ncbi:MAG: HAD-IA family hydrolase [Inhella sp.]
MPDAQSAPLALLIDLDGTLVDTVGDFVAALQATGRELGLAATDPEWVRHAIGRGGQRLVQGWLAHHGAPPAWFDAAWVTYSAHYAALNGQRARVFDGVREALPLLGMPLACVTNKPQANAEALLRHLGLRDAFAAVVGQQAGLRPTPHPDALWRACEALGVPPAGVWMVGDSRNDAESAEAAGCAAVVLMTYGYNHGEPVSAVPARAHLHRLDHLPALWGGPGSGSA